MARIDDCSSFPDRILWDSLKAPLRLAMKLPTLPTQDDLRLHYVSLDETRGISLAFDSVRPHKLLGIISHGTGEDRLAGYSKIAQPATWVHCPLRSNLETILGIWLIEHRNFALGWTALMVSDHRFGTMATNSLMSIDPNDEEACMLRRLFHDFRIWPIH